MLVDNFGDTREQKYVLIEKLINLKQVHIWVKRHFLLLNLEDRQIVSGGQMK